MHGRVKVRTSEEQAAIKAKERQERLAIYVKARDRLLHKRQAGERDVEALALTGALLPQNPDLTVAWNFRREILLTLFESKTAVEKQATCVSELEFLNSCLQKNPKSYGVWNHRRWTMQEAPQPPVENELELCTKFLSLDERNFHCWDYRRHVVASSGLNAERLEKEFEFSLKKIADDYSNFSAWHYRSKLLPIVRGDGHGGITEDAIAAESTMLQSAFCMSPGDQSIWFYHRWLLGREHTKPALCYVRAATDSITFIFSQPVQIVHPEQFQVQVDGAERTLAWDAQSRSGQHSLHHTAKLAEGSASLPASGTLQITIAAGAVERGSKTSNDAASVSVPISYKFAGIAQKAVDAQALLEPYIVPSHERLCAEEAECRSLLELLTEDKEPEIKKKYVLQALAYILQSLSPSSHSEEISSLLNRLKETDSYRRAFYADLLSKHLCGVRAVEELSHNSDDGAIDLSSSNLTALYHVQHFCRASRLVLSKNSLRTLDGFQVPLEATEVVLDDNCLTSIPAGQLAGLSRARSISLRNNRIAAVADLAGLRGLPQLQSIDLTGNPVHDDPDQAASLQALIAECCSNVIYTV
eukprot:m.193413 g.193413  ORF g.193413 m.193413 type:complete len:585 (-) comp17600_c0_seq1:2371-4125(-)